MGLTIQHCANTVYLVKQALASGIGAEFNITVWNGRLMLGHPTELRRSDFEHITALEFVRTLIQVCDTSVKVPIAIDIKASVWNQQKEKAEFGPGELNVLTHELPRIISLLQKKTNWSVMLFSGESRFFESTDPQNDRGDAPTIFLNSIIDLNIEQLNSVKWHGAAGFHIMISEDFEINWIRGALTILRLIEDVVDLPLTTVYLRPTEDHNERANTVWEIFPNTMILSDTPKQIWQ